jgi:ADP-dependent NAD(P)H-hydrate dehydratase / NAD(P)H-hydrate epimerase
MIALRSVAQVRAAEERAFRAVPEGALMQRAARALSVSCAELLAESTGRVVGSRVVLLVGSGNNGGDALWAGAMLAARGCRVDAACLSDRVHPEGAEALRRAGGHRHDWVDDQDAVRSLVRDANLVVDGILGIGGSGGLRPEAAGLAAAVDDSGAIVVAVDLPSGVDADTGGVTGTAITADVTVTFGAVKPGLLVAPGRYHSGIVQLVEIGLDFDEGPVASVLTADDVAAWVREPAEDDYKYRRGVVGVCAGSRPYPGAALLVTSAARSSNVGMVRYLDRGDGNAAVVVGRYPDVVVDGAPPAEQLRATAWACGSGFVGDTADGLAVRAVLEARVPVVLDAGALTVVAEDAGIRAAVADRTDRGLTTVLTPHEGEFERIQPGLLATLGRLGAARAAAAALGAVIVLKGPGTVVVDPEGNAFVDIEGTAELGTAGSGDVLTGVVAAVLSGAWADGLRAPGAMTRAVAAAVWVHGRAGREAAAVAPVTATDIADAVPAAIRAARSGDDA